MDQTGNLRGSKLLACTMYLLALAGCADDAAVPDDSAIDPAVVQPLAAFFTSFNAHSVDNAADFTTDDWNHITPSGLWTRGRPEVVAQLKLMHMSVLAGITNQQQSVAVRFASPEVAVAVVTSKLSPANVPDQTRISFVLVKPAEKWLIMHDQHNWIGSYQNTESFAPQVPPPAVQSDAEKAVRAFMAAWSALPISELLQNPDQWLTEDANLVNPSGGWTTNRNAVLAERRAVGESFLKDVVTTVEESTVRFAADDVAVVVTTNSSSAYTGPDGVLRKHPRYVTTDVLVYRGGRWLSLHTHITSISA